MAENRAIYARAMEQSREAARAKKWDESLKGAARAMQEFPQDEEARTAVAVGLYHTGRHDQALKLLSELRAAAPGNPFFLEYIARTQEQQGTIDAALESYQELIRMHQQQRAIAKTISVLRDILRLRPELDDFRDQLARMLTDAGQPQDALREYMTLARRYQAQNRFEEAVEHAETVLRLDPEHREAKELIATTHETMAQEAGLSIPTPEGDTSTPQGGWSGTGVLSGAAREQQFSLEKLASQAIEQQEAGDLHGAAATYQQAIAGGLTRSDIFYSLGLIHQELGDHNAAIPVLEQAARDPEYGLSAHFALGVSYSELEQFPQAAQEYEQAIQMVDLETVGRAESEDLIEMYEQVTAIYQHMGDLARAASLYSTLAGFLQSKRWGRERAADFTKKAKELTDQTMLSKLRSLGTGALRIQEQRPESPPQPPPESPPQGAEELSERWGKITPLIEMLRSDSIDVSASGLLDSTSEPLPPQSDPLEMLESLPQAETDTARPVTKLDTSGLDEQTERWVIASERYMEQHLLSAAIDACYEVISLNLDYLPIHLRIGEIYERLHEPEEALSKYQTLIDTYNVRDEPEKAIDVYLRYIALSPETINARSRLAELLRKVGRVDEAAEQLIHVAGSYFRLGQPNRSMEEFRRGLQWAPKHRELRAQYGMALFKLERYEAALGEFQKAADPHDPLAIAHINMTLAVLHEEASQIWDSLAALLELLQQEDFRHSDAVQAEYRTAVMIEDDPLLHYILSVIQHYSRQYSSALLGLEQALSLLETADHPILQRALVHQGMASNYLALEQPEQALEQLQLLQQEAELLTVDPSIKHEFARPLEQGELIQQMADAYADSDDLEGAENALREALRLLPYNRAIYTKLADVCFRQGKLGEALSSLENLSSYYEERQELDSALETLEYALKLAPSSIPIGLRLARMYIRRGYPDKGVEGLLRVAELQRREGLIKDAVASMQQAAEVRWMQGRAEETLGIYDRIVQIAPNDVEARQWRAIMYTLTGRAMDAISEKKQIVRILVQAKDLDNAIAELHQIIGLNTGDVEAYFMLGDMLMRRGEYTQAVNLYNRMLKMDNIETDRVEALQAAAQRMLNQNKQVMPS